MSDSQIEQPKLSNILDDLNINAEELQTFKGGGSILLESPNFDGRRTFPSRIFFRRPADLYVHGRHRLSGTMLFRMLCVNEEFVMEFPKNKDESYYQVEGEEFEDVPYSVSPSDIAREMFLSEDWGSLKRRHVRMLEWNSDSGIALLEIGPKNSPRRRAKVALTASEPNRWVVVSNELLNENTGEQIALTLLKDYTLNEGIYFPAVVDATYPTEDTRMKLTLRDIDVNIPIDSERFDIRAQVEKLGLIKR